MKKGIFLIPSFSTNQTLFIKTFKTLTKVILNCKAVVMITIVLFATMNTIAQKGLFARFSIGPGYTSELSALKASGISIVTKNHAIGYGITDKFAVQIGEFGGLNKINAGIYNYVNLDVFGLGFTYLTPLNLKLSVIGGYSIVSFAEKWSESFGEKGGSGYGINTSIEKEWFVAKRWALRFGPQFYWLKTTDTNLSFFNASLNGSVLFYLLPVDRK